MVSKPKLFVAMPVYGGFHPHFVNCLLKTALHPPCEMEFASKVGDSLVSRARNNLANDFLESDCTHLLFLDTDLIFSPEQIGRLVSHDVDIVAGVYPKKQRELAYVLNMDPAYPDPEPNGLHRMRYAGTGCLLIKRRVFEVLRERHPENAYGPEGGENFVSRQDFFPVGVKVFPDGGRRYLSEDWYFCQNAIEAGFIVWADTAVAIKHCGDCVYPIDPPELTEAPEETA